MAQQAMQGNAPCSASQTTETAIQALASNPGLTIREKIILLESSRLNGHKFPPWKSIPYSSDFDEAKSEGSEGSEEPSLSSVQLDIFDGWRRPIEASAPTMLARKPIDLVQDITTDCSVVASLCAAAARPARGLSDIVVCNLFPRDHSSRWPAISPSGRYIVKLFFNGCSRKVIIDDRLPTSRSSRQLHVVDRNNPGLLWPALIEKAYLMVRGGYDFPGSNSGTDLWVMTGWVPEQLFIQSDQTVRNAMWQRLFAAFNYGDVLITMGTGKMMQSEEQGMGLVGEHDYAVIDMRECEGQKYFLMKNPWSGGSTWKGHSLLNNTVTEIGDTLGNLHIIDKENPTELGNVYLTPGMFWIGLDEVFQSFESIYLNWNPQLFPYKTDVHFNWDLSGYTSQAGSFVANPQYVAQSKASNTIWLLLSRHFSSSSRNVDQVWAESPAKESEPGFISLYAFDNNGDRVVFSDGSYKHGPYVDSPNTLLKLDFPAAKAFTIVVSEQSLPRTHNTFTLSAYSLTPISLFQAQEKFKYSISREGAWTHLTAGGNANFSSYNTNPQFKLDLIDASDLLLLIESRTDCLPVHVKVVWAKGKQIQAITSRDVLGDSGEYRKGCALAKIHDVQAGIYTIVCSTFDRGQLGSFALRVQSMSVCTVDKISTESAGCFITKARLAVFAPGSPRLLAPLVSHRLNRLSAIARSGVGSSGPASSTCSPLKLSLEHGQGPSKKVLASSGDDEYLDGRAGVRTPQADVQPRMCTGRGVWLVIERLACSVSQINEYVEVELLSEEPIELQAWGVGEG